MEAIARPLRRLQDEIAWFCRATEVRLLHVVTDATLRGAALDLLMGYESHADNRGLFFRFDDPMVGADRGWPLRVQRSRDQFAAKIEAVGPAGIPLRPLDEMLNQGPHDSRAFASMLLKMSAALAPPLTNVVVAMAPVRIEDPLLFAQEMSALIASPHLGSVRWIVVEADGAALTSLTRQMQDTALSCTCVVDEGAGRDDLRTMGVAEVADLNRPQWTFPLGHTWRAGGAMPDVAAPVRVGQPPAARDETLIAAGLSPQFANGGAALLKRLVLGAALAMREQRIADAVTLQSRAAALCADMQMPREQVINLHALGGYLMAASRRDRAREVYLMARDVARTHGLVDAQAQSELALGMMEMLERHSAEAATHYAAAARLAETAQVEPLAIECWRMAGQLALDAKLETSAVDCWKRALLLAGALEPALAKTTSAPEVARALAAVCRKRGLMAQAQSLEQRSVDLDQGTVPATPAGPTLS